MTKDDVSTYKHAAFVHEHICKQIRLNELREVYIKYKDIIYNF